MRKINEMERLNIDIYEGVTGARGIYRCEEGEVGENAMRRKELGRK